MSNPPVKKWGEVDAKGVRHYPLHRAQWDILQSSARFTFAFAGTGSGKTVLIPLWLAKQIEKNEGKGRYLLIVPTYNVFEQCGLMERLLEVFEGTPLRGKYIASRHVYECATGAKIFIRSSEYPESIEGGQYNGCVLDEAAKISARAWMYAKGRVGQLQAPILGVTTPDVNSWIYNEIYLKWKDGDKDYYVRQWSSSDNPTYSKEAIEHARLTMSKADFERRYLGQFARLDGLVYETFSDAVLHEEPVKLPSRVVRVAGGIDWGWNDPLAVVIAAECEDGRLYIVEEFGGSRIPLEVLTAKLKALRDKWSYRGGQYADVVEGGHFVGYFADHSRPEIKDLCRKADIAIRDKRVSLIEAGISIVDRRLRTGFLKVYSCCERLIEEANLYQRIQTKDGDYGEKTVDKNNHFCLAAGTMITTDRGDVPIEDIHSGMRVLTRQGYKTVIASGLTQRQAETYTIVFSNGKSLIGTKYHPLYVKGRGFLPIDKLRYSDRVSTLLPNVATVHVLGVFANKQREDVYNLTVDGAHEFYANGFLSHNCDAARYLISGLDFGRRLNFAQAMELPTAAKRQMEKETLERLGIIKDESDLKELEQIRANTRFVTMLWDGIDE